MRKVMLFGLVLSATVVACESKTPVGPSSVTVQETTTTTSVPATTTVPVPGSTTVPPTSTIAPTTATRRYVGTSANPALPNDMTLALNLVTSGSLPDSLFDGVPLIGKQAAYTVTGFYRTGNGGGGTVRGTLDGTLDSGTFRGTLSTDVPGCSAARDYSGQLTATNLTWSGGEIIQDCKDSPFAFSSLTMVNGGTLPPTTTVPTTTVASCSYGLDPGGASIGLAGGSGSVRVLTQPGCGWSAQSLVPWVTLQPASGSSGPGSVQYTVESWEGQRSTTLIIAGLPFVLTQQESPAPTTTTTAPACTYALSPTSATFPVAGGSGDVTVVAPAGCAWTVQNFASWITVSPPASGTGSGLVHYTAALNDTTAARESTLVIAGLPFVVRQDGPILLPDLVPYAPNGNFCRYTGSTFVVGVQNIGLGPAGNSVTSLTFTPVEGTPSSASLSTIALSPGGVVDVVFPYVGGGPRYVTIVVDTYNQLAESNEENNTYTTTTECYFGNYGRPVGRR